MAITPQMIKELREQTGAGFGDVKNALTEANGNMEEATKILRKKGLAAASKKAGRVEFSRSILSERDEAIVRMLHSGVSPEVIGERLVLSPDAVRKIEGFALSLYKKSTKKKSAIK